MGIRPQAIRGAIETPKFNPILDPTMQKDLMTSLGRRHAVVYGDWGTGKTHRLKTMAQSARNGVRDENDQIVVEARQVVVFAMDTSWYGLNGSFPYSRYGRNVHGLTIQVEDADGLAQLAMEGDRESQIVCLQHLQPEEVSRFLKDYFTNVLGREAVDTVFVFDILDEQAGRKRHHDAITAINLKSLVMRGKSMGVSVYASATSPTEIPLEIVHQTAVAIFGRMSHDGNLKGMRMIDRRIANKADSPTYGAKYLKNGVQFFLPQDGSDYPLYFARYGDIDVGGGGRISPDKPSKAETSSIGRLSDERSDRERKKSDAAKAQSRAKPVKAASNAKVSLAKIPRFVVPIDGSPERPMQEAGIKYVTTRVAMARILMSVQDTGTITMDHRPAREDVMAMAAARRLETSAEWVMKRQYGFVGIMSASMGGALHAMLTQEAGVEGEAFLDALFGYAAADGKINELARRLRIMEKDGLSLAKRLSVVLESWKARHDGAPVKEAVIVSMETRRAADTKEVLPSCA